VLGYLILINKPTNMRFGPITAMIRLLSTEMWHGADG